jgi:hypothetical protein
MSSLIATKVFYINNANANKYCPIYHLLPLFLPPTGFLGTVRSLGASRSSTKTCTPLFKSSLSSSSSSLVLEILSGLLRWELFLLDDDSAGGSLDELE